VVQEVDRDHVHPIEDYRADGVYDAATVTGEEQTPECEEARVGE
jgi:hypothetical protein